MGASDDAGDDYVMFMSSRVISLDVSHARVQILHDNGEKELTFGRRLQEITSFFHSRRFEPLACILARTEASFYWSDGFIWCDNVSLR